jgi:hypothetical protein
MLGTMELNGGIGLRELSLEEANLVGAADGYTDVIGGIGGIGAGTATVGGGLAMEAGIASIMVIGGGVLVGLAGVALLGYGIYELAQ